MIEEVETGPTHKRVRMLESRELHAGQRRPFGGTRPQDLLRRIEESDGPSRPDQRRQLLVVDHAVSENHVIEPRRLSAGVDLIARVTRAGAITAAPYR